MAKTALDRAERLFAAGRYADMVSLLEPQVPIYRESSRFYYLLGAACLNAGDAGGAYTYLKRAEQLAPESLDVLLALAALELRRGETEKAVTAYLSVLERKPGLRSAQRALEILKEQSTPEGLAELVDSGRIKKLYPKSSRLPPWAGRAAAGLALCALIGVGIAVLGPMGSRLVLAMSARGSARPQVAAVTLDAAERAAPVGSAGSFRYVLTDKEALACFDRAKAYFQQYRDNAALIEINRLLGSNASAAVKEKATTLKRFVGAPDFRTVRDAPSFAEVAADSFLYDGCSVVWRGMAANVRSSNQKVDFDFLVGYDEKKTMEGIIAASASNLPVFVDRPLEVLATISSASGSARLEVAAIHELLVGSSH